MTSSFPSWPVFEEDERLAVDRVLASGNANYWSGEEGRCFEEEFAAWCGAQHGVCVSNGTLALEIALKSVGIKSGDEIIVSPRSFLATAAAVVAVGATPVFVDVDLKSGNITPETITSAITSRTKGVVVVHICGWPADMVEIMSLANKHSLLVIEDCAQAHGASVNGRMVGSFGHASTFSFCQDKIMSTGGEGGMIVTSDNSIYERMWSYRDHGRDRSKSLESNHPIGFRWLQTQFGTNARMTEMQSAIGRCQLKKIDSWLQQRRSNASSISKMLTDWEGVELLGVPENFQHAFYRLGVLVQDNELRNTYMAALNSMGIPASVGPCPEIYREEAFRNALLEPTERLPIAQELGMRFLAIPTHPGVETALELISRGKSLVHP